MTEPALSVFAFKEVPVAFEKPRFVPKRFVDVVFVPVAFVQVRFVVLSVVTVNEDTTKFVNDPFVAKRFVVVTFAPVAFVKVTPVRDELPVTLNVPVAEILEVVSPPNNVTLDVANAPRFVTEARVSTSAPALGQPTPFCKQIPCPATVAVANEAIFANKLVVVAVPKEPTPVTPRDVDVTFVPVAFVNVTRPSVEESATVSVPVTLALEVVSPPKNVTLEVANAPRFVTDASVSLSVPEAGQFVPSARHTFRPFTKSAVVVTVVPEIVVAFNVDPVAFPNSNVATFAVFAINVDPVAEPNVKRPAIDAGPSTPKFVVVVFVPVALDQVILVGLKELTERLVNAALVAKRFVEVEFVVTMLVPEPLVNVKL